MASVIEKNVLGFQITVNDVETVQALQSAQQFSCIEPSSVDVKPLFLLQMVEELSAVDKRQNKIQLLWRLEREFQWNDEGVVDLSQNRPFGESMRDFGSGNDVCFANSLEGVDSVRVLLPARCE